MNFIHRETFEARLCSWFDSGGTDDAEDMAWYALRNAVYASGARLVHFREGEPSSWSDTQKQGWRYFQNAFSVHNDLIYSWSSVVAVQALTLMVCSSRSYAVFQCFSDSARVTVILCRGHRGSQIGVYAHKQCPSPRTGQRSRLTIPLRRSHAVREPS
jgi:hypothetical protein